MRRVWCVSAWIGGWPYWFTASTRSPLPRLPIARSLGNTLPVLALLIVVGFIVFATVRRGFGLSSWQSSFY